jgi:hypothetical protein
MTSSHIRVCARRCAVLLATAASAVLAVPIAGASAAQTARFGVAFTPDRLGQSTTITFDLALSSTDGGPPAPLSDLGIRVPEQLGFASSTLGLSSCAAAVLRERGPRGCPANSRVGEGEVVLAAPLGSSEIEEHAAIGIYMGEARERHTVFEFYAQGSDPVIAKLLFEGSLLSAGAPFGFDMDTPLPATALLPGEPPASVVSLRLSIGPRHLTYYKTLHGRRVAYRPSGISVPETCPRGRRSFPFEAQLLYADGSRVDADTTVACRR